MESLKPTAPTNLQTINKAFSKIRWFHRGPGPLDHHGPGPQDHASSSDETELTISHLKLSTNLDNYLSKRQKLETLQCLIANLFSSVSAIKASYAEIQLAENPFDPDTIQRSDRLVVSELKRLSELKQAFLKNQLETERISPLTAHLREQQSLVKTYEIMARKVESEFQMKDAKIWDLKSQLEELERQNRGLESRIYPGTQIRNLSSLDGLHLSGLNPTHFLTVLRCTVKSVRSFVKMMVKEMVSANWDLDLAAKAVHPKVRLSNPNHRRYFFESYVCQKMFSNFHRRDFNLSFLTERETWDKQRFFEEFKVVNKLKAKQLSEWEGFGKFCRAKYLSVIHPKMEISFFGRLEQRALVSSGPGFPDSEWFSKFLEMGRRIWLLHCLFYSFEEDWDWEEKVGSVFQVENGARFSEVYMESVVQEGEDLRGSVVGFTVVPGFRVEHTVIQSRVYLTD
ncbi:hypothetical protein LUZ60_003764 [Juncus effusus]|nr:hypothetical protein LUZ60_003764 [Juncus effusus]